MSRTPVVGQSTKLVVEFRDDDGNLVDPDVDTISLVVDPPATGGGATETIDPSNIVKESTGIYYAWYTSAVATGDDDDEKYWFRYEAESESLALRWVVENSWDVEETHITE